MGLLVHLLVCLLGTGSWVAINGVWVELPLIVPRVPEGWLLPTYLTVIIQLANLGPLAFTLAHRFLRADEVGVIYGLLALGCLACLLLAFFWQETRPLGASRYSLALLVLLFFLALVDCTSSVTFLPYMRRLPSRHLTTYFVGEGLSGLLPGLVALGQGASAARCVNASLVGNGTTELLAEYQEAHFSIRTFFLLLSAMMALSLAAFLVLNHLPGLAKRYRARQGNPDDAAAAVAGHPMLRAPDSGCRAAPSRAQKACVFGLMAWANALTNGLLPPLQSYSCLPYGRPAYHLSAALGSLANPLACFLGMFLVSRSLRLLALLSGAGSLLACYIISMATLSPCPPLLHSPLGVLLIVICWVLFTGLFSYVKLMVGKILRDEGRSALVWCGAVVQLGSMVGALIIFPLVSVYGFFHSGDPCSSSCPS
ncbi:PREDICTED: solute carrier family 52, riboflavin transporter, member 2 [Thamnophis sirtalis]|uniref:Riboflavin transporter n=1 Tax=Thamnophis sirtalis TaxID=35019 RepID=A0A6I9Y356_9SAUR|nr:PREDICTED: solute carrier family 52, riboflavin transporter, member 2 [Thamnophis sirtalis]